MGKVYMGPCKDPITNLWFLSLVITIKLTVFKEEDNRERWWLNLESGGCWPHSPGGESSKYGNGYS